MKKRTFHTKAIAFLLVIALSISFAGAVSASTLETSSTDNPAFVVDGIDAYLYPYEASKHFDVTNLIYLMAESAVPQVYVNSDAPVEIVYSMSELVEAAVENPFAAIVVDSNATALFDEDQLLAMAERQHIILIKGYNEPGDADVLDWTSRESKTPENLRIDLDNTHFSAYYVSTEDERIIIWNPLNLDSPNLQDLFIFANQAKNDLFYIYDAIMASRSNAIIDSLDGLQNHIVSEYDVVGESAILASNDWDTSENNLVKIYKADLPTVSELVFYDAAGGTRLMTVYDGEAVLHTGITTVINNYTWYEVRAWRIVGANVYLVEGWIRNYYSNSSGAVALGACCESMYMMPMLHNFGDQTIGFSDQYGGGYTLKSSANLYDTYGTYLRTLPVGARIWVWEDEGYAGRSNPHYVSISGYTLNGTYYACTSTTFFDAGFDTGTPTTYNIYT